MQIPGIRDLIIKNLKKDRYSRYLELMPDFKKEKTQKYTTLVLTLFASTILGVFAISPTLSTIASLQKQLDDDKFVEQKLQEKINNLSVLQQRYSSLQNDLPLVYDAIPKSPQIPLLLAQIQSIANESDIQISNFQSFKVEVSKDAMASKKFSSYDFVITASGDYQSMLKFMDKLSNFQRIITINNISISKTIVINVTALQLNIKGSAYFKE